MIKIFIICMITIYSSNAEKVIIDTDAGSDDAIAILMLLRAESLRELHLPQYEVIGITCSYGNTKEENVEVNVLKTLTIANRSDIPVFAGARKPLIGNFSSDSFFGKDGFGDADFPTKINGRINRSIHASDAMIELSKKHEGNISIIVIGPTTNVALAITLDANFTKRINKFYVMGSTVSGIGNFKPNVEFNFAADPESNFILLNSTKSSQLTLFPFETGYNAKITKKWRKKVLGKFDSPYMNFLNAIEKISLQSEEKYYTPIDSMTIAIMLWPQTIKETLETNVEAVHDGAARGAVLVDWKQDRPRNAKIIRAMDSKMFLESLVYYLTCEKIPC